MALKMCSCEEANYLFYPNIHQRVLEILKTTQATSDFIVILPLYCM